MTAGTFNPQELEQVYQRVIDKIASEDAKAFIDINPNANPIVLTPSQSAIIQKQIEELQPEYQGRAREAFDGAVKRGRVVVK